MSEFTQGACYVAIGRKATDAYRSAFARLNEHVNLPSDLMDLDRSQGLTDNPRGMNSVQMSRWAKTNMDRWSPYDDTLYLDADTHVLDDDIMTGFDILADGWDMVITPSDKQADQCLWHCDIHDRITTMNEVGPSTQLQAGVFWFRKSERVAEFFKAWREEWLRFKGQDQGALLRALDRCPIRVWLLGYPFNGGAVVAHNYGMAREN